MAGNIADTERAADRRIALVIGNGDYVNAGDLGNPCSDARAMAEVLRELDFEVIDGFDLTASKMDFCINDFAERITNAHAALFYYAGHGLQVDGENYLVPVDAVLQNEGQLTRQAIALSGQLKVMTRRADVSILFLDCCRDNPFVRSIYRTTRDRSRSLDPPAGLAKMERASGSFIAFATDAGAVAADGQGEHSPFTAALLEHIATPGQSIADMMTDVTNAVMQATNETQNPWTQSSLRSRFYFKPPLILPQPRLSQKQSDVTSVSDPRQPITATEATFTDAPMDANQPQPQSLPDLPKGVSDVAAAAQLAAAQVLRLESDGIAASGRPNVGSALEGASSQSSSTAQNGDAHIKSATKVVGAIAAFGLVLLGFWVFNKPHLKVDCTNYAQLMPEEQEICDMH
jgi:uncharacterized caspase-like protein